MLPLICSLVLNAGSLDLGTFVSVPCSFEDRVPAVTMLCTENGITREHRLLLDSGCAQTMFFRSNKPAGSTNQPASKEPKGAKLVPQSLGIKGSLGELAFAETEHSAIGAEMAKYFADRNITGILGADFFRKHDVLIDYLEKKVYFSPEFAERKEGETAVQPPISGPDLKPFSRVPLFEFANGFKTAAILPDTKSLMFLLVDTGSGVTTLPFSSAPHEKPGGVKETSLIGAQKSFEGWSENVRVRLTPLDQPFEIELYYLGESPNVIAPSDLGSQVLFSFRRSEMWIRRK